MTELPAGLLERIRSARIEQIPLSSISQAENNPRTHTEAQIEQIVGSVLEYGWTNPVLVDEGSTLIAGHGRFEAATRLGLTEVPAIRLSGLSPEQKRAYLIADNKLALNSGWDTKMLAAHLSDLGEAGYDVNLIGFSDVELGQLFSQAQGEITESAFARSEDEWKGMPEFQQDDKLAWRSLKINFAKQEDLDEFVRRLEIKVTDRTAFLWYPQVAAEHVNSEYRTAEAT